MSRIAQALYAMLFAAGVASFAGAASAATVVVTYMGVTSTGEGAYIRTQDFLAGTTVYTRGPVYDDVVSGTFTIDTARMPAFDEDSFDFGQYLYETRLPVESFGSSTFTSKGNIPTDATSQTASLFFPRAGASIGQLSIGDEQAVIIDDTVDLGNGNVSVHRERNGDIWLNTLSWDQALPILEIDGVALPDFSKITDGAFASAHFSNRYTADEIAIGAPDGPLVSQKVSRWESTHNRSSGRITSMTMRIEGVPEASTWAMMIAGFAVLGLSIRREKAGRLCGRRSSVRTFRRCPEDA